MERDVSDLPSPAEAGFVKAGNRYTLFGVTFDAKRYATNATHKLPRTWAQIAIIPRNKVSEASAAASSTTARNMANPFGSSGREMRLPSRPL